MYNKHKNGNSKMKLNITKVLLPAMAAAAMTGCANHDLIPDITEVGQAVPTV